MPDGRTRKVRLDQISENDVVVAVMGPTGAGKTTASDYLVGRKLRSRTAKIRTTRYVHPAYARPIIFVDTPGFDDTSKPDTDILRMVADWLVMAYSRNIKLAGVIYLHRISDNRMSGASQKNLRLFTQICGDSAMQNVTIVTTMWNSVREEVGTSREAELRNKFWRTMLEHGAETARYQNTFNSAWEVLDRFTRNEPSVLQLQMEMVDSNQLLRDTQAGIALYLQQSLAERENSIRRHRETATIENDSGQLQQLDAQLAAIEETRRSFYESLETRSSLGRRILKFLTCF
ncbi:P-loop containing nucleoside triphosphate hydrolase protein [Sparassis latifolia]